MNFTPHQFDLKDGYRRYVMIIEYAGDRFFGWQRQETLPTVQALIEDTLTRILGTKIIESMSERVIVYGSGRTDAGVHALGQTAHFDVPAELDCNKVKYGLNFFLQPHGASVLSLKEAPHGFHARFSAKQRAYRYIVLNRHAPSILLHERAWHIFKKIEMTRLEDCTPYFLGTHDFTSFRDSECQAKSPIRTIDAFTITKHDDCIHFDLQARSFLHHQVRIMVGTIIHIGLKEHNPSIISKMIMTKARKAAGPTAPANGLFFLRTTYVPTF